MQFVHRAELQKNWKPTWKCRRSWTTSSLHVFTPSTTPKVSYANNHR